MKNYYLLLFLLFPLVSVANESIYSDKDFMQLKGLYQLTIEEKEGVEAEFDFIFFAPNYTAYFNDASVSYVALSSEKGMQKVQGVRIDVEYVGHSVNTQLMAEPTHQRATIRKSINGKVYSLKQVKTVRMQELYPGIDLEFFVNENEELQYLYDLRSGANPEDIQVKYIGSESVEIGADGELVVKTSVGVMTESSPVTLKGSKEKEVRSQFVLNKDNSIGFAIKRFKPSATYIIDPYIKWSTFYGGTGGERVSDLDVDDSNYVYVTGYTESTDFPTSPGAFQTSLSNQQDIAIVKLDSSGNLEWSTYFGGDKRDEGFDISVADDGKIYITGITESSDFPVSDNSIYLGGIDAVLIALKPDGSRIRSGFIGGASDDRGESIVVDGNSLYIGGSTSSNDFPTAGPGSLAGDLDAFLMKTDLAGNIIFCEFYGGQSAEEAFGLALDDLGNLIIAGRTSSSNLPVSSTAFQTTYAGLDDAFLAKFSPSGNLLWSTYYGSAQFDQILDIGVDTLENIYFSGITSSNDLVFPSSLGPDTNYQTTYGGGNFDGLAGKVNASGQFRWASYFGGSDHDEFQGIGVSDSRSIIISGKTYSADFEVTSNADQTTLAGGSDAVIVQFDSAGNMFYSSFLGGSLDEDVVASTFGKDNRYFFTAGNTKSPEFPTTPGTAQPDYAGNNDMFIVAFCAFAPNNSISNTGADTIFVCPGTPLPLLDGSTPTGGSGQYSFQYQQAPPGGTFVNIPGATNEDYQIININSTTRFRRIVFDGECSSISPEVIVFFTQQPQASFSTDAACDAVSDSVHFTDLSQANGGLITSYSYYFGDGDSSNLSNPVHLYDSAGAYTAMLIITTNQGCVDTAVQIVDVSFTPVAGFSFVNPCANQPMQFTNSSSINSGAIFFNWDFGDDSTSSDANPVHFYADTGTYTVQLIAYSGSCADTVQQIVTIMESPLADFSFDISCPDSAVVFTNMSSIASGSIVSYEWNFGDNTSSNQVDPVKVFSRGGPFTVELVATANTTCTDTVRKQVNPDSVIVADFSFINNCLDLPTQFNSLSTSTNGTIVSYDWRFGDGMFSTLKNPTHTYTATGSYLVTLIITSDIGCVDTVQKSISINPPPLAAFTISNECPGTNVNITNLSLSSATDVEYIWDFGDGTGSSDFEPVKSYDTSGTFTVILTVVNDKGCAQDTSEMITIYPEPLVDFSFSSVNCLDTAISFSNNTSISSGSIVQYNWDFGDGTTSILEDPSHTYTDLGNYTVSLIATSNNGCIDSSAQELLINPIPHASFSLSDICPGVEGSFENLSTSTITDPAFSWDFGDGTFSSDFEPVKSYASQGIYTIKLIINENGCTDDTSQNITVLPEPIADFTFTATNCLDSALEFTNTSTISAGTITQYYWDFGDGTISRMEDPEHLYDSTGNYDVSLIVGSNNGCMDTISKNISLSVAPIANFNNSASCAGQAVQFIDSSITSDLITDYFYDFGDGNTANTANASHTYFNSGNYTVTYRVTTDLGCTDEIVRNIEVSNPPSVDAGPDRTYVSGNPMGVQLNATGSSSGSYVWSPDSGLNTPNNPNPLATPGKTTTYTVTFTNEQGCVATDEVTITVLTGFEIPTAFSPNNDGYNDRFEISKIECYPYHNMKIYDQWGALLYENTGSYHLNPWDGTYEGEDMPFASYFYVLDLKTDDFSGTCADMTGPANKRVYKGTVTILR